MPSLVPDCILDALQCDGQTHTSFTFVAALAVLVYPIGIPVSFFLLLRRDQKARTEAATQPGGSCAEQTSAFKFLRSDYKADWYYFEVRYPSKRSTSPPEDYQCVMLACAYTVQSLTRARCNCGI